jgi:hypothetical protein
MKSGAATHVKPRLRWPWNRVRGFKVESLASGAIRVEPDWIKSCEWPDEPGVGGPGLFSRMRMALWIEGRLRKPRAK